MEEPRGLRLDLPAALRRGCLDKTKQGRRDRRRDGRSFLSLVAIGLLCWEFLDEVRCSGQEVAAGRDLQNRK